MEQWSSIGSVAKTTTTVFKRFLNGVIKSNIVGNLDDNILLTTRSSFILVTATALHTQLDFTSTAEGFFFGVIVQM